MAGIRDIRVVAYAVCALLAALSAVESAAAQDADLRIVVIEGEDSVNIIAQGTAVPTLVEVRDRNDLPVSGASVLFLLGEGGTATLNAGLQPGRDAQAMERFPDTVDHAEHRQRYLDRDGSRVGGLAGRLPPVMLRHGWQSPFLIASPALPQDRGRSRHPLHISSSSTASGTSPKLLGCRVC